MYKENVSLFSNCILVKGYTRAIIYDFYRNRFDFIPDTLYYILSKYKNNTIDEIKSKFNRKYDSVIDEYFNYLIENEYVFFLNKQEKKLFPPIDLTFDFPSVISNCIIDINRKTNIDFKLIFHQLKLLSTYFIEMRFFDVFSFEELKSILEKCNTLETNIQILIPYEKTLSIEKLQYILMNYSVSEISIYNYPTEIESEYVAFKKFRIHLVKTKLKNHLDCGKITPIGFILNRNIYFESQHQNTCLNRKISIDVNGDIKNCPSMNENYGNIKETTLEEALNKDGFKKYWDITKDQILVCKDCEFRYMCVDCRAYKEIPEDNYSKPLKCGYNPYRAEWEEWSSNPLKQKVAALYGMKGLYK